MFAVVHIPQFALQAVLRHEPEAWSRPLALVDGTETTPRVIDATSAAREAGVTNGLTMPQSLARCRELEVRHRSTAAEGAATDAILQCAYGFSPNLEATAPGTVTLDLRGLAQLSPPSNGAETEAERAARFKIWAQRLRIEMELLIRRGQVGIGATPNVARHAARWGVSADSRFIRWVARESSNDFIASLPVAALEPSSDVAELLHRWGIRTVGELLALGQAELADRLGLEALGLFAAASATSLRPLRMVQPPERFEEAHAFDPAIETLEPLLFLLRRFVDALVRRLGPVGLAAGRMALRLRLESGATLESVLRLPQPTRQADILFRVLHTHLETVHAEAPVQGVALHVAPARPVQKQFGLFEAALRDPHQLQETLARLVAIVGSERVGTPLRENSHRPDAFRLVPPEFEAPAQFPISSPEHPARPVPRLLRPAPLRRLRPALTADVDPVTETSNIERPTRLGCSLTQGPIVESSGPWQASGRWWDDSAWQREEWDVELHNGLVLRLVRQDAAWAAEAVLD